MITPGKSVNNIKIGDDIDQYPDAKIESKLSLNQTLYKLSNGIMIRTNSNQKLNWILVSDTNLDLSFEMIKIGLTFGELIEAFSLLYDEDESHFKIDGIDGLIFSFGPYSLNSIVKHNRKIDQIIICDISMEIHSHFWFDTKLPKQA